MKFLAVLQLIVLVLKLTGLLNWSWWIILIPAFVWVALIILMILMVVLINNKYPGSGWFS